MTRANLDNAYNRRKPCCDPFGKLMDHQRICRNATPCTSESHCDPSAQDPDECPLKPLSPGTACVSNAGVMGVCGQDESLGKCIVEESQALEHDDHQYTDHLEGTQGLLEISHQDVKPDFLTATTESQDEVATEPMLIFAAIVLVLLGIALTWLGVRLWKSKPLTYPVRLKKYWSSGQLQSAEEGGKPLIKVAKK
ncbi:hypothetical protein BC832DRAFT_10035 [Gaertneriomyces semiglobifer]|nr:hypothetical protein BC832DRAFT_10035 [Gaertneriomyces semiglobifer]